MAETSKSSGPAADKSADRAGQSNTPESMSAAVTANTTAAAEAQAKSVDDDPYAYESQPGESGVEAVGSGRPIPVEAVEAMRERTALGVPEPPKVGPVHNTDLYATPGGYVVLPAGVDPADVGPGTVIGHHVPRERSDSGLRKAAEGPLKDFKKVT